MLLKKLFFLFLITLSIVYGQDSTRIEAFRNDFKRYQPIIKAKYPSYSLLASYVLISDANRNDPFAQHELGLRYLLGNGFPKDTSKAIYWIRKAVDQNLPIAKFNYAIMLYNGIGLPWNPFEAYHDFKFASDAGLPEAQFAMGLFYTDNLVVSKDLNKAYVLISKSAKGNYEPAKDALKNLINSGFIPAADSAKQIAKVEKPGDESSRRIDTKWDLDYYNFENEKPDTSDSFVSKIITDKKENLKNFLGLEKISTTLKDTSAITLLYYGTENGSPEAAFTLAKCFEKGMLVKKDLVKASMYYLRALRLGYYLAGGSLIKMIQVESFTNLLKDKAAKGDADALYSYAGLTALGINNELGNQQVLESFKKAAEKNHIPSIIELGLLYSSGSLMPKNISKAVEYWNSAKSLGSKEAEVRICFAKILGENLEISLNEAVKIISQYSEEGSILAQMALAYCFEKGIGMIENKIMAVRYYRMAASRGSQSALNSLKRMYDEIRPDNPIFKIYEAVN